MVTLLASLSGFFSALFPQIIKYFFDKNDKKHELEILRLQLAASKGVRRSKLEAAKLEFDAVEVKHLYSTYKSGIKWIDALNASVRPILAYSFFVIYASIKLMQYFALADVMNFMELYELLWTLEDQAIFAGIISFYYGQRAISKIINKK
jgi:hypothetical protein